MYTIIKGKNAVMECLKSGSRKVYKLFIYKNIEQDEKVREIEKIANQKDIKKQYIDKKLMDRIAESTNHQGIVIKVGGREEKKLKRILSKDNLFIVILEDIKDPRNFGSILRTAECAGVDAVFVPHRDFAPITAETARASAGATEYVSVIKTKNTTKLIDYLKKRGITVIAADMDGKYKYTDINYKKSIAVVLGGNTED